MARIGPWGHGEARNGGHPDWLVAKAKAEGFELRNNNPSGSFIAHLYALPHLGMAEYLSYVQGWYQFIAKQLEGLYFKDGGPVAVVQVSSCPR